MGTKAWIAHLKSKLVRFEKKKKSKSNKGIDCLFCCNCSLIIMEEFNGKWKYSWVVSLGLVIVLLGCWIVGLVWCDESGKF